MRAQAEQVKHSVDEPSKESPPRQTSGELRKCWRAHSRKCRACTTIVLSCAAIVETLKFWFVWLPAVILTATSHQRHAGTAGTDELMITPVDVTTIFGPLYTPFYAALFSSVEERLTDPTLFAVLCARPAQWPSPNMVCVANGTHTGSPWYTVVAGAELPTLCRVDLGHKPCIMRAPIGSTTDRDVVTGDVARLEGVNVKVPCNLRLANLNTTAAGVTVGPTFPTFECPNSNAAAVESTAVESVLASRQLVTEHVRSR